MALLLLSSISLAFLLSQCFSLYRSYQNARTLGLPIVISPVDPRNILWQLVRPRIQPLLRLLPNNLIQFAIISNPTWSFWDKAAVHQRLGPALVLVCPGINHIWVADPDAVTTILTNRKEFPKPNLYNILNVFGRNVDTVNGEEWTRHRKLTASCFNERISSHVWDESLRQAEAMLSHWLTAEKGRVRDMVDDTRIVTLHVLSAAGFGVRQDFGGGVRKVPEGHTMSFRDSLMLILFHLAMVLTFSFNLNLMLSRFMPKRIQRVGTAVKEFRQYMDEMLDNERQAMTTKQGASKPNLINTLIRESDEAKADANKNTSLFRLTDDEIKGNIFIFNLAGHDTTANTLAYAISLLAIHSEYQTWLAEELDHVLDPEKAADYESTYPRLKRCQAIMYETLRLYGPVTYIPRDASANEVLPLSTHAPQHPPIPPRSLITLNLHAIHTSPAAWGPDPLAFRPTRWIIPPSSPPTLASPRSVFDAETPLVPPAGSFIPWSVGPRVCPGMKFAQVEFAAVMSAVFARCRVAPSLADRKSVV